MEPLDESFIEGWDEHGIHCWSAHRFDSIDYIEQRSEHIAVVDRTLTDGAISSFNFRRYTNRYGDERFVMICIDDGDVVFEHKHLTVWITDREFFEDFVKLMWEYGEIDETDYRILIESCGGTVEPVDVEQTTSSTVEQIGDTTSEWLEKLFDS